MDAQSAQQPTSTTYARPQQPAEAFAATLPVETLSRIFELALQHFEWPNEEKGQAQRVNYGLVCRSWCSAALPLPHYTVSSSAKAQRLAQVLQATDRSRQAVRSLDITSEGEKVSGRGAKIAKLLSLCPKLERLTLDVNRDLCAPGRRHEDGALGKVVRDALCKVQLQEVGLFGVSSLPVSVLNKLFEAWPNSETLGLYHVTTDKRAPFQFDRSPARLLDLQLSATDDLELTRALLHASRNTLQRLDVGDVAISDGERLMEAIKIVASQLLKFTIRDAEAQGVGAVAQQQQKNGTYLEELIKAMPLLRSLTIGFDGVELSSLFTLLAKLKHLRYFVLRHNKDSPTPLDTHLSQLDFSNLSAWLASPPSSLRMVGLPVGLLRDEWWEENEFGDRRSAVLEKGVELCLVD